ncbi:hypothetical protein J6590_028950 [Homalodisca vitripennis]|nr:hypothetical protein J6590_028950 [Homalodisca vitripennis]
MNKKIRVEVFIERLLMTKTSVIFPSLMLKLPSPSPGCVLGNLLVPIILILQPLNGPVMRGAFSHCDLELLYFSWAHCNILALTKLVIIPQASKDLVQPENCRQISLLPIFYKVLQRFIQVRFAENFHQRICSNQSGFRDAKIPQPNLRTARRSIVSGEMIVDLFSFGDLAVKASIQITSSRYSPVTVNTLSRLHASWPESRF